MITTWTNERLQSLFDRYNRIYWRGKLPRFRLEIATLDRHIMGQCFHSSRTIKIDLAEHKSDRELRGTLLHEMAHAGDFPRQYRGHGLRFFAQIERLLRKGAPITVKNAEAGQVQMFLGLVPARFPLLKRKMEMLEARRVKRIDGHAKADRLGPGIELTDIDIIHSFEDCAHLRWKSALFRVGTLHAMVDETYRPLDARARRLIAKGRIAHRRVRRDHLEHERRARALGIQTVPDDVGMIQQEKRLGL